MPSLLKFLAKNLEAAECTKLPRNMLTIMLLRVSGLYSWLRNILMKTFIHSGSKNLSKQSLKSMIEKIKSLR